VDEETCPGCLEILSDGAKIGRRIQGVFDGILFWMCAYCGHKWHRFEVGTPLWELAEPYVNPGS
jgi:RNase P subunit RPR2